MAVAVPLIAGAVGQALATNLAWSVAANYAISTATFGAIVSVGGALGAALGAALIAPGLPDVEGPQALEGMAQVSTYGKFINVFYGRVRSGGNIIWSKGIREVKTTEEVGGKGGGGGQSVTTYTYYCSWALALGEGKVKDIHKIWFDADLVYDGTVDPASTSIPGFLDKVSFYYGSEDQLADPIIQASEGIEDTPSYRGISYIVFDDLLLTDWGNRIPNITVELSRFPESGVTSEIYPIEFGEDGYSVSNSYSEGLIKNIFTDYIAPNEDTSIVSVSIISGELRETIQEYQTFETSSISVNIINGSLVNTLVTKQYETEVSSLNLSITSGSLNDVLIFEEVQPETTTIGLSITGGTLT